MHDLHKYVFNDDSGTAHAMTMLVFEELRSVQSGEVLVLRVWKLVLSGSGFEESIGWHRLMSAAENEKGRASRGADQMRSSNLASATATELQKYVHTPHLFYRLIDTTYRYLQVARSYMGADAFDEFVDAHRDRWQNVMHAPLTHASRLRNETPFPTGASPQSRRGLPTDPQELYNGLHGSRVGHKRARQGRETNRQRWAKLRIFTDNAKGEVVADGSSGSGARCAPTPAAADQRRRRGPTRRRRGR